MVFRAGIRSSWTLRLAAPALLVLALGAGHASAKSLPGAFTPKGAWGFVSAPRLHPPRLLTQGSVATRNLSRGDFLLDTLPNLAVRGPMTGQGGPLIVNQKLVPVWAAPTPPRLVSGDLQQESYEGRPVLVWWQGSLTDTGATISGEVIVVDQHYRRVATLKAKAPWVISLHDAVISGNAIWVTVYRYVRHRNLTAYGGHRNGTVYDAGIQEYDLRTGKLLYTWDALNPDGAANVPLTASEQPASAPTAPGGAWDAYHVNSIQVISPGQILVSMRNTWAAYLIDTSSGKIVWTLGGRQSSFRFGRGAHFAWQHDVRLVAPDEVTLFDDECCRLNPGGRFSAPTRASLGMALRLNFVRHTASLVRSYPHRPNLDVAFLGSMQLLPNGNALVGWGSLPYFSEFTRSGREVLGVRFPGKDQSYRALFTSTWVGTPSYPPRAVVRHRGDRTTVYVSWNGATEVTRWQVLAGSSSKPTRQVALVAKTGFETAVRLRAGGDRYFQVRALSGRGGVLGTTRVLR